MQTALSSSHYYTDRAVGSDTDGIHPAAAGTRRVVELTADRILSRGTPLCAAPDTSSYRYSEHSGIISVFLFPFHAERPLTGLPA